MRETLTAVIGVLAGAPISYALGRTVANDGRGHRPPPRSHRDDADLTQHEKLRRLAR